jgi:predicted nuclease of predicted toxin-antitoxin system
MKFLVDAQLPPALARRLEELGHEAAHVADLSLAEAADHVLWSYAATTGAILISKDQDFALMRVWDSEGPPLIWIRIGNTTRRVLLAKFDSVYASLITALENGEVLIELTD